jgi:hypothetical protein
MKDDKDVYSAPDGKLENPFIQSVRLRVEQVKTLYEGKTIIADKEIESPVKQTRNDPSGRTCLVAVAINVMKAMGIGIIPSEEQVLAGVTINDPISKHGEIRLEGVLDYLEENGLRRSNTNLWGDPEALVDSLLKGGAVIETVPATGDRTRLHAKLLAGIRINNGHISLREYDPDPNEPESKLISLDQFIEDFYRSKVWPSLFSVVK